MGKKAEKTIALSFDELLALVWTHPITALRHDFHISDVALRKRLAKFNLPFPEAGYRQKVRSRYFGGLLPRLESTVLKQQVTLVAPSDFDLDKWTATARYRAVLAELRRRPSLQHVSREEFYRLLGVLPQRELSTALRISPNDIETIRMQHGIPGPTTRDWTNLKAGRKVGRVPLPPGDNVAVTLVASDVDLAELLDRPSPWQAQRTYPKATASPELAALLERWAQRGRDKRYLASREAIIEGLRLHGLHVGKAQDAFAFITNLPPHTSLRRAIIEAGGYSTIEAGQIASSLASLAAFVLRDGKAGQRREDGHQSFMRLAPLPLERSRVEELHDPARTEMLPPVRQEVRLEDSATLEDAPPELDVPPAPGEGQPQGPNRTHGGKTKDSVTKAKSAPRQVTRPLGEGHRRANPVVGSRARTQNRAESAKEHSHEFERVSAFIDWLEDTAGPENWAQLRDLTLIYLMKDCGLSIAEALTMRKNGIDLFSRKATYKGRLGATRAVDLTDAVILAISRYGKAAPPIAGAALFINSAGQPLGDRAFRRNLANYLARANIAEFDIRAFWLPRRRHPTG